MSEELIYRRGIAEVTQDIRRKTGEFLLNAIEIGRLLFEAKAMVEPGGWTRYIEEELPFSHSWANNYMKLYKEFGSEQTSLFGDSQTFLKLRPTQALELLSLPQEDRETFMENHDVENMSTRQIRAEVQAQLEAERHRNESLEAELEIAQSQWRDAEQNVLDMQQQLAAAKSSEGAWQQELDKLNATVHLAQTAEKNANNKVEVLENQLKEAQKKVRQAKADLKKAMEHPEVPESVLEELRAQAEAEAAEKAEGELQKKLAAAAAALDKEAQKREAAERQLEAAKKQQTMADPNLMAIQTLGKQMLSIANSINGHRMKSIMQNEANAKPINGYLAYVVEELRQAFGIKKEEPGGNKE